MTLALLCCRGGWARCLQRDAHWLWQITLTLSTIALRASGQCSRVTSSASTSALAANGFSNRFCRFSLGNLLSVDLPCAACAPAVASIGVLTAALTPPSSCSGPGFVSAREGAGSDCRRGHIVQLDTYGWRWKAGVFPAWRRASPS